MTTYFPKLIYQTKMKKNILVMLTAISMVAISGKMQAEQPVGKQLLRNINIGWDINHTNDYRWSDFHVGTAYGQKFEKNSRLSWQVGVNYNWNKYTLFADGNYALGNYNAVLRNQSLSIPGIVSYELYKSFFTGIKLYTGPVYEMVYASTMDRIPFYNYNPAQFGWTIGTKIRFLAIFNTKIAYNYYPTPMFRDGTFNRSALSLSVGF
jgi:hypothetical protein